MAECQAESLDICEPVITSNTFAACDVNRGGSLPDGRKGVEPTKAPLGHFLLKLTRWLSGKESWADAYLREGTDSNEALKKLESASSTGYSPLGAISIVLAVLLILFLVIYLLPLLWCRCTREAWTPKAAERKRSNRSTVIVCFSVLVALACLFYYGSMWYSVWMTQDLKATSCTIAGVAHRTLYEDVNDGDNGNFKGVNTLITKYVYHENSPHPLRGVTFRRSY